MAIHMREIDISKDIDIIRNAVYGEEVRASIINALKEMAEISAESVAAAVSNANEAADHAYYAYRIANSFTNGIRPMGSITFEKWDKLEYSIAGDMYNITDEFITNDKFVEGPGITMPAGTNVVKLVDIVGQVDKWDAQGGMGVVGIKGENQERYYSGNVELTPEDLGALSAKRGGKVDGKVDVNNDLYADDVKTAHRNAGLKYKMDTALSGIYDSKEVAYRESGHDLTTENDSDNLSNMRLGKSFIGKRSWNGEDRDLIIFASSVDSNTDRGQNILKDALFIREINNGTGLEWGYIDNDGNVKTQKFANISDLGNANVQYANTAGKADSASYATEAGKAANAAHATVADAIDSNKTTTLGVTGPGGVRGSIQALAEASFGLHDDTNGFWIIRSHAGSVQIDNRVDTHGIINYGQIVTSGAIRPRVDADSDEKESDGTSATTSCGTSAFRWSNVYCKHKENATSDRNEKENIKPFSKEYEDIWFKLKPVIFKFLTGDRIHSGFIAQDVEEAIKEAGLTNMDWGLICKDLIDGEWKYSLRDGELISLNTHMLQKLYKIVDRQNDEISELKNKLEAQDEIINILTDRINKLERWVC